MRKLTSLAAALAMAMTLVSTASAAATPFTGSWESIDTDGSYQLMTISGASPTGRTRMALFDSFGSVCVNVGATSTSFHGLADATTTGNVLEFSWRHVGCGDIEAFFELGGGTLVYDAASDTMADSFGITWTRIEATD